MNASRSSIFLSCLTPLHKLTTLQIDVLSCGQNQEHATIVIFSLAVVCHFSNDESGTLILLYERNICRSAEISIVGLVEQNPFLVCFSLAMAHSSDVQRILDQSLRQLGEPIYAGDSLAGILMNPGIFHEGGLDVLFLQYFNQPGFGEIVVLDYFLEIREQLVRKAWRVWFGHGRLHWRTL